MATNLQNVFDAIVGFDGATASEIYSNGTAAEIEASAVAQAENYYEAITQNEAHAVATAVIAYRNVDNQHDGILIREALAG